MRKVPTRIFPFLVCLLLSSCFDLSEEIWIESDGGGRAELRYRFPAEVLLPVGGAAGLDDEIRRVFASQPDLRLDDLEISSVKNETTVLVRVSTDSLFTLLDLQETEKFSSLPKAASDFAGTFEVGLVGNRLDFSRNINIKRGLGLGALAIGSRDRAGRKLRYTIHLPAPADTQNATSTADGGSTLIWEIPLGEALRGPISTDFQARIPIPWWAVCIGLALIALPVWAIVRFLRRRGARIR